MRGPGSKRRRSSFHAPHLAARRLPVSCREGEGRLTSRSALDEAQALVERAKHAGEVVAALEDQAGRGDHAVGALAAGEFWRLLDAVKRNFGRVPKHGEHGLLAQDI